MKMIGKLKHVLPEPAKDKLRTAAEIVPRLKKRRMDLVLASPYKAEQAAYRAPKGSPNALTNFEASLKPGSRLADRGVSIHQNVVAYPLTQDFSDPSRLGDYFYGGLADGASGKLIQDATHYNGVAYCQSLPASYAGQHSLDGCGEIQRPVMFGGLMFNHFAHFLVESVYRLYAYPMLKTVDPYLLFYPTWGTVQYLEKANYANQVLEGFGIPPERIILARTPLKIKELALPTQKYGYGWLHEPDAIWVDFVKTFQYPRAVPPGLENAQLLYVARSGLRKAGSQVGEKQFEEYLVNAGYTVFAPEKYSLYEQLTVYTRAKKIIFAEGGAIQSCVLLPNLEAEVAVICRRRDPRRNIPVATACIQGYGKPIDWIDCVRGQYRFGMETWEILADIDWAAVSEKLRAGGFVQDVYQGLSDREHAALLKADLRDYLREVVNDQRFVDYMANLKETLPEWEGPSHLFHPRDGKPIWPSFGPSKTGSTERTNH